MARYAAITGTGSYAPEKILTNFDLEKIVDTSDEWIRQRTGIVERHIVEDDMATSDLGIRAARLAMKKAGIDPLDIEMIIVATVTPDAFFPLNSVLCAERNWCKACVRLRSLCGVRRFYLRA